MMARHLSPSIRVGGKIQRRFLPVIRSARPGLPCTRMERQPLTGVPARNTAQSKTGACPCSHKNWNNGKKNQYKTVPDDYRLSIDSICLYFKRTYTLRTECERYNPASNPQVRSGCGCVTAQARRTSTHHGCRPGRRFVQLSLLPRIQIIQARRLNCALIRLFHTVFPRVCFLCSLFLFTE